MKKLGPIFSVRSGNASNPSTWHGGMPRKGRDCVVAHQLYLDRVIECDQFVMRPGCGLIPMGGGINSQNLKVNIPKGEVG
jgi:hypothetical protein